MADAVSTVRVGGRNIATPGAYSETDLTGAQTPALVESGVVALIGDAIGGQPGVVQSFDNLDAVKRAFTEPGSSGNPNITLYARLLFNGNADSRIAGGPQRVLVYKTNPDTQSTGVMQGSAGPLINLTSEDYGAQTNSINFSVSNSTSGSGVDLVLKKGATLESVLDLGGDAIMQVNKPVAGTPVSGGSWSLDVDPLTGASVDFSLPLSGLLGTEVVAGFTGPSAARVVSTSTDDTYQEVVIYGLDAANNPLTETVVLDGTNPVLTTTATFDRLTAAEVKGVTAGDVTISDTTPNNVMTFNNASEKFTAFPVAGKLDVRSAGSDVGQIVVITGLNASGSVIVSTVSLDGSTDQETADTFSQLLNVQVQGTTTAAVEIRDKTPQLVLSVSAGTDVAVGVDNILGMFRASDYIAVTGAVTYSGSDPAVEVVVRGVKGDGTAYVERFAGAGPTVGSDSIREWTHIELGATATAEAATIAGSEASFSTSDSVADIVAELNDKPLFDAVSFASDRLVSEMDTAAAVTIKDVDAEFFSRAADVVDWINENSDLVTAERVSGASGLPLATASPVFLAGATDGVSTNQSFFDGIDALKAQDVDIIVPLTESSAVHAYLVDHLKAAKSTFQSERNAYVGIGSGLSIDQIDALTVVLNNEDISAVSQKVRIFDELGEEFEAPTYAGACIAAGQQASSAIGTPLTRKFVNILGLVSEPWDPVIDSESLLRRGLMFLRFRQGRGHYWVRSITTYRQRANRILTEMSANESLNKSRQDLREYLEELLIGVPSTIANAKFVQSLTTGRLNFQVEQGVLTAFANVSATRTGDLISVDYDAAPVEPTNFVRITTHVVTETETA
jgi:hypothetical protein